MNIENLILFSAGIIIMLIGAKSFFTWLWQKLFEVLGRRKNPYRIYGK